MWKNRYTFIYPNNLPSLRTMNAYFSIPLILISMAVSAQNRPQPTYTRDWKRADSLAAKGLPKSASDIANRIYTEAKAAHNYTQVTKAAIYRTIYRTSSDENEYVNLVNVLRTDIFETPEPAKSVLQSVLADLYWQYFQQNRHQFYDRATVGRATGGRATTGKVSPGKSATGKDNPDTTQHVADFRSWDAHQLIEAITTAYSASLRAKDLLQKTPVTAYEALIEKGDASARPLRPTLFDLLAHRAIGFFQNSEPDLLKPVFEFKLDKPGYFAEPAVFVKRTIQSQDSLSGRYQALRLYQQLLAFHLADSTPDALADVDVLRLAFVHQHSVLSTRDSLYRQALEKQVRQVKNKPAEAAYAYQLADFLTKYGAPIRPLDEESDPTDEPVPQNPGRWQRKQAADICRDLIKRFPNTWAARRANQLLTSLLVPGYALQLEQVNTPGQPFRMLVSYQNVPRLTYRLFNVSTRTRQSLVSADDDQRKRTLMALLKRASVLEKSVSLPDDGDLNHHAVEVPMPALPVGQYVVLATMDDKFQNKAESIQYAAFTISGLGFINSSVNPTAPDQTIYVINRLTGEPVKNASVALRTIKPLAADSRNSMQTDGSGQLVISASILPKQEQFQYLITAGTDTLLSDPQYSYRYYSGQNEDQTQTYARLFTDRAIYRPGQLIYVKGLLYDGKINQYAVVANQSVAIELLDQNGERMAQQTLTTNEFGTFAATFTAPIGRLTGAMTLQTSYGGTSIRVEEYKRPTFQVKADPIKKSVKLGQTVTLTASAKTFSGAVVEGASVRYRVIRKLRPRWEWWYIPRNTRQTEITNGITQTDAQGNISITFLATPDLESRRQDNPLFDFETTIDVTDKAGETRSTVQTIQIGYSALQVSLAIPAQIELDKPAPFPVKITNQAGENVSAKGLLTVYKLQTPARPLRNRLWSRPDRQLLTKAEFEKLFPNDVYANENDPRSWPKGPVVQQQPINAPADSLIKPDISRYTPGEYVAELTVTDSAGTSTKERAFFAVVNDNEPVASARPDNWVQVRKATAKPGEEAVFWVGNSQPGESTPGESTRGWVLMMIEENHQTIRREWIKTDGRPRRVALPITEKQRGGFAVHFAMIQNGRLYQKSQLITVPFTNKELQVATKTFRTKLKPGEREEWTLTIRGLEKQSAEVVATLYDASLDSFDRLNWPTSFYQTYSLGFYNWQSSSFNTQGSSAIAFRYRPEPNLPVRRYDELIGRREELAILYNYQMRRGSGGAVVAMAAPMQDRALAKESVAVGYGREKTASADQGPVSSPPVLPINPRKNFNETAFFVPQAKTDKDGNVVLTFTMPEALTRWRLLAFAHAKDLKTGTLEREIITQKELMITANAPRFFREGDTIRVTARINNLSDKTLPVTASLALLNALTGEPIHQTFKLSNQQTSVSVAAGQGQAVGWTLIVPANLDAVTCRLTAQSGSFTDGEEFTVPVLSNRMLVTDTKPFWVNGKETKTFTLKPLANLNPELPVQHERLTVEVTSNPGWYVLQSLPYLMEYRYECAEQLFSRLYANSLAAHIVNSKPAFKQVIAEWQKSPAKSPLQSNEELKAVTLENSPWLADARSESERQAKLGQLLDANRMESEQVRAFEKLKQLQTESGGFRWFGGMDPNLPMTLHILSGLGHLQKLGVRFPTELQAELTEMQTLAIQYADADIMRWVNEQKKLDEQKKSNVVGGWYFSATQYLYARSFYLDKPVDKDVLAYLKKHIATEWLNQSLQGQALSAMALNRFGDTKTAAGILQSLLERSKMSEEMGLYWPDNTAGLNWYQAPIETQAYLIEAVDEIKQDRALVDEMKRWLLRQKQTQSWSSTKATTEAVYALLLRGSDWLGTGVSTQVSLGGKSIQARVSKADAITGYEKVTYAASEIKPEMGAVQITKTSDGPAWGALYWQHFEPLDQVMPGSAGLSVQKTLYVQRDSPSGPIISTVASQSALKPGDLVKVRLVLKTDRAMEYVHLKDSRASGFEPVVALSGYKYQNGLGYYESPRDASTDFFMSYLPVGTHVFEYDLRVAQAGDFSAGVATVQCFYAPEFSAHSAGERVKVK